MTTFTIIDVVVTRVRLAGADIPPDERREVVPDQLEDLEYTVNGRADIEGKIQFATFTGQPFRHITSINLLTAKVGSPARLLIDTSNRAEPKFLLFGVHEEFLFDDCTSAAPPPPGGVGMIVENNDAVH